MYCVMRARNLWKVFLLISLVSYCGCLASRCTWSAPSYETYIRNQVELELLSNASLDDCKAKCEATDRCNSIQVWKYGFCALEDCGMGKKCELDNHPIGVVYHCLQAPSTLIVVVSLTSSVFFVTTFAVAYLMLNFTLCESAVGSVSLLGIAVSLGAMPLLFSSQPNNCAIVKIMGNLKLSYVFPLNWLSLVGSVVGVTMACLQLRRTSWRYLHAFSRFTVKYFFFATGFNIIGFFGGMLLSCSRSVYRSEDVLLGGRGLLGVGLAGSIGTTLILHNLMALRAGMVAGIGAVAPLRRILYMEIVIVIALGAIACITFAASYVGLRSLWFWIPLIFAQGCIVVSLFVTDLFFSWRVIVMLYDALKNVRASSSLGNASFARSLRIATLNVATVFLSVCTTSLFYGLALIALSLQLGQAESANVNYALFIAWVLDSLGNDACAIYIGFGPTAYALEIVASARNADVIGTPVAPVAHQDHNAVTGHVLAVTNTNTAENRPTDRKDLEDNSHKLTL